MHTGQGVKWSERTKSWRVAADIECLFLPAFAAWPAPPTPTPSTTQHVCKCTRCLYGAGCCSTRQPGALKSAFNV